MPDVSLGGVSRVAELENMLGALVDAFDNGAINFDDDAEYLIEDARQILDRDEASDSE